MSASCGEGLGGHALSDLGLSERAPRVAGRGAVGDSLGWLSAPGGFHVLSARRPSQTWTVPLPSCARKAWLRTLPCGVCPRLAFPSVRSPVAGQDLAEGGMVVLSPLGWFLQCPALYPLQACRVLEQAHPRTGHALCLPRAGATGTYSHSQEPR